MVKYRTPAFSIVPVTGSFDKQGNRVTFPRYIKVEWGFLTSTLQKFAQIPHKSFDAPTFKNDESREHNKVNKPDQHRKIWTRTCAPTRFLFPRVPSGLWNVRLCYRLL